MERLAREDWLRAARLALLRQGPEGVRVEPLARHLGVTKGSFYWHFRDRADLLETLIAEWEEETSILSEALKHTNPREQLPVIFAELNRRARASERGESPSDAAMFAWAATDSAVARRTNRAEEERMRLFRKLTGKKQLADLFYYAYHGFLLRRKRVPGAAADLEALTAMAMRVFVSTPGKTRRDVQSTRSARRSRAARVALILCMSAVIHGCTSWRIVRWRDPSANKPVSIFPQRVVRPSDAPFRFALAAPLRTDLDTVSVRDVDFRLRPFSQYVVNRRIKAFVVIRNDTIVYELYRDGYTDSTRSSSFSVAKSVTSALVGIALQQGAIKSVDDTVTRYVPELAGKSDFAGITVGNLLAMKSGFAYSRTNGKAWHDFRSSDAHFYYTTDVEASIAKQRREVAPGTHWAYKDSDTQLLGWLLSRATGKSLAEQLEDGVWRRIGTEHSASWDLDHRGGRENAASGLNATARDFARFGRLYLNGGAWQETQIIDRAWVMRTTTLDRSRATPEVNTWWQMQHNHLWWIPMHNWDGEQDFYADGSRGQRIYVNRRLNTVIVQLADESAQDFPFRKIAHYLAGEPYVYPRVIANQLYASIMGGASADSVRSLYRNLLSRSKTDPASFSTSSAGLVALERQLISDGKPAMAAVVKSLLEMELPN